MLKSRKEMMDDIIKAYGFENPKTIHFCELAEKRLPTDSIVEIVYIQLALEAGLIH